MARYTGVRGSITPVLTNDNWTLHAASGESGKILEVHWGGEVTSTNQMETEIKRATTVGVTITAGTAGKVHPNSPTNLLDFATGWTTQPVLTGGTGVGTLFGTSWNAHGGVVRWLAAPGEEFIVIGMASAAASISCRNYVGTSISSYGLVWDED